MGYFPTAKYAATQEEEKAREMIKCPACGKYIDRQVATDDWEELVIHLMNEHHLVAHCGDGLICVCGYRTNNRFSEVNCGNYFILDMSEHLRKQSNLAVHLVRGKLELSGPEQRAYSNDDIPF